MAKSGIDIDGLADRLKKFEELCAEKPVNVDAVKELYHELDARLGYARAKIYVLLQNALPRNVEAPERRPATEKETPSESPIKHAQTALNYETPTTVKALNKLLEATFGVSNKPLHFSKVILAKALSKARLEYRGDWAVFCTLLSGKGTAMNERTLEDATGYNAGSVSGSLNRLQTMGLVRKLENDDQFIVVKQDGIKRPNSPTSR